MNTFKRNTIKALAASLVMLGSASYAQTGSIKLMVGFPAGGGTDVIARVLGEQLSQVLGTPVVVDNRAGAGGQIAAQALKAAPADGSVLFLSHDHTISILPLITKAPGFKPDTDFVPVAGFATFANETRHRLCTCCWLCHVCQRYRAVRWRGGPITRAIYQVHA